MTIGNWIRFIWCIAFLSLFQTIGWCSPLNNDIVLKSKNLIFKISPSGNLKSISCLKQHVKRNLKGTTFPEGFQLKKVECFQKEGDGVEFQKDFISDKNGTELLLKEKFTPTESGIRWTIEITSESDPMSTPIITTLNYPVNTGVSFWTPWADPRNRNIKTIPDDGNVANGIIPASISNAEWADPLVPMPLKDNLWYYGAPYYSYENPKQGGVPFNGDVFCIPIASLFEKEKDLGLSIVLSPEDLLLDLVMNTTAGGEISFTRMNHRLGKNHKVSFSMDIVSHPADWRAGLGWMQERYPAFFNPSNPMADQMAGTGAYIYDDPPFDVEKLRKMAFKICWTASFDFPYMGMFIPPVGKEETWKSFVRFSQKDKVPRRTVSVSKMDNYCEKMDRLGFKVLSYFNVTEFGAQIEFPPPEPIIRNPAELWKNANDFLYGNLKDAILLIPEKQIPEKNSKGEVVVKTGNPYYTWERGIAMDPGVKSYQDFLMDQASRHVSGLPHSYGICIDRMDWLRFYNHRTDDQVSWFGGQPVGSLLVSWKNIMQKLDTLFHNHNKVIFVNNHVKRIETLRYVDGIFDEFTYAGTSLNTIALLGMNKPVTGWLRNEKDFLPDPDAMMQRYLYLGVFPMAPFPDNDHALRPTPLVDSILIDYGPLLKQMVGKKWILKPHVVKVENNMARVNIYRNEKGYAIPVTYGGSHPVVKVIIDTRQLNASGFKITAMHPGSEEQVPVRSGIKDKFLELDVPLKRGCAMVLLKND